MAAIGRASEVSRYICAAPAGEPSIFLVCESGTKSWPAAVTLVIILRTSGLTGAAGCSKVHAAVELRGTRQ